VVGRSCAGENAPDTAGEDVGAATVFERYNVRAALQTLWDNMFWRYNVVQRCDLVRL
jgi:hypothetical protein